MWTRPADALDPCAGTPSTGTEDGRLQLDTGHYGVLHPGAWGVALRARLPVPVPAVAGGLFWAVGDRVGIAAAGGLLRFRTAANVESGMAGAICHLRVRI